MTRAYEEIVDFIAGGSTPADVARWAPSQPVRDRVAELVAKQRRLQVAA